MATYIVFVNYTEQGLRDINNSLPRIEAYKQSLQYAGVKLLHLFRMMGPYDLITIVEAPDEKPIVNAALRISSSGNVRIQFYRVFNDEEFAQMISGLEKQ
jgi:uncharacterized protein with GYD domain